MTVQKILQIKLIITEFRTTPHEKIPVFVEVETITIKIDLKKFFSIATLKQSQNSNRQYQNHRSKTPKHQRQFNRVKSTAEATSDPVGMEKNETSEFQLSHTHGDSTECDSETEYTLTINLLRIEHETPVDSGHYQNEHPEKNPKDSITSQITDIRPSHNVNKKI